MNQRMKELFKIIKDSRREITDIQKECPHTNTYEGLYEWHDHYITNANICEECGKALCATGTPVALGIMPLGLPEQKQQ